MSEVVLDASALLALLNEEPGKEAVEAALPEATIGLVNLAEVVAKLADAGMPEEAIRQAIGVLGLRLAAFDEDQAYRAGLLRPTTKALGLSLGDRACLALAQARGLPALTAEKSWKDLAVGVEVRLIR